MRGRIDRAGRPSTSVLFIATVLLLTGLGAGALSAAGEGSGSSRPLAPSEGVWIEQVVTHPYSDWNEDGRVSPLDEHIVLRNEGPGPVDLGGWALQMLDTTDEESVLEGGLESGEPLVVMNPPGRVNNDVALRLLDGEGAVVDEVALGTDGIPDGRGESMLDEAVHLTGPWAGERAPGSLEARLGPVWVSHLAAEGTWDHAEPLRPAWVEPDGSGLVVRFVTAPGFEHGPWEVHAGDEIVGLEPVDEAAGLWRTVGALGPSGEDRALELVGGEVVLASFPSGDPLGLIVDPVVPSFVPLDWPMDNGTQGLLAAVADAGSIRWFPPVETGASGLVEVVVRDGKGEVLEDCVPLEDPGPGCIAGMGGNVSVGLKNGAGRTVEGMLPVVVWDDAPEVPELAFEPAASPTFAWERPSRPAVSLTVQVAQDPEGTWMVGEHEVPVDSSRFVDASWVPGEPRAYRLFVTDLAGNQGVGPWRVLKAEHVPVQVEWDVTDPSSLGRVGETGVTLRFDRALQEPPVLALRLVRPVPLYLEVEGEPIVSEDAYSYQVRLPARIEEAVGTWSLVGGLGTDGAPVDGTTRNVTWDRGAPRVVIEGTTGDWIPSSRHVLNVQAVDAVDPAPVVSLSPLASGAKADGEGTSIQIVLHEEGSHGIEGVVRDKEGNERVFSLLVGLDATPPTVKELERPASWSSEAPLRFQVRDEGSQVNRSSLTAWARDLSGAFEVSVEETENGTFRSVPVGRDGPVEGPFEVYVAVADQAGNGVEGFLSGRMVRVPVLGNVTASEGKVAPAREPVPAQAPSFLGPPWAQGGERADASMGSMRDANASTQETSRWDAFSWEDVPREEEERSWGWYVAALVGAVTLGTAVHRVRSKRNGSNGLFGAGKAASPTDRSDREDPGEGGAAATDAHGAVLDPSGEGSGQATASAGGVQQPLDRWCMIHPHGAGAGPVETLA